MNSLTKTLLASLTLLTVAMAGCTEGNEEAGDAAHGHTGDHDSMGGDHDAMKEMHQAIVAAAGQYPVDFQKAVMMSGHAHAQTAIEDGQVIPTIDLEIIPDPKKAGQYNLRLLVTDFEFAPQNVSLDPKYGEGHTHVYVDDVLIARAYGEWFHLAFMEPGDHTVKVTLNHNDHSEYALNGESIFGEASFTVLESADGGMMHGH